MAADARIAVAVASPAHAALFAALHEKAILPAWDTSSFATLLAQPGVAGWIATHAAEPVGLLLARMAGGEAEILTLAVDVECRRRGVARALLATLFEAIATQNVGRIFLEVAESNYAARALYAAHGFLPVGRRAAYYGATPGSDALVLACARAPSRTHD
ncbi:MAG: GNAT family N-acetyltransferase [Dongiaceae bacterium]